MICIILDNLKEPQCQQAAAKCVSSKSKNSVSYPRPNTYWFRDWFLHLYNNYGRIQVINNFFELLAVYFPKSNEGCPEHAEYGRDLNWGEFIHFWSGAARTNLKKQATKAFGWSSETQTQFEQAQNDFPLIVYKN
ncbi:MAG: hypothetical protein GAK29_04490 [Acinetobacter bereziniae]|uniref:Uncharacterized protein n=1 Tax=Acinetobacter bereziniae TaxID=106648 RepID=A0A833U986_ACIBZ|nr:MAG: hypothetical protein GAK29_04490 [Acinetobacter bereziniae]